MEEKLYYYSPKDDITPLESALLIPVVSRQGAPTMAALVAAHPGIVRHFTQIETETPHYFRGDGYLLEIEV